MKKVFAKSLLVAAMFSVAGSALAVQKDGNAANLLI